MSFCQYCGTKLEDGQVCDCEMSRAAANQPQIEQPVVQPSFDAKKQAVSVWKGLTTYIGKYIADPAEAVRSEMEAESWSMTVCLTVIRLLAMGLAIYGFLRKVCSSALSIITTSILRHGNTADILTAKIAASFFSCLIYGALIAAVGMLLFVVVLFLLAKIQHSKVKFSVVFKASAANGLPISALLLLAFLFSLISITACLICFVLAMLFWMVCGVLTVRQVCGNGTSSGFWLMYFVGIILIFVAGYYIMPSLFLRTVGSIDVSYMNQTYHLQRALDAISEEIARNLGKDGIIDFGALLREGLEELASEIWYNLY